MATNEIDELFTDSFLDSLDGDSTVEQGALVFWVVDDKSNTTYKAYHAILELKALAEQAIDNFGEVETNKTPKFYQLKSRMWLELWVYLHKVFLIHRLSALILELFLMMLTKSF